jgi:hypothetical protein
MKFYYEYAVPGSGFWQLYIFELLSHYSNCSHSLNIVRVYACTIYRCCMPPIHRVEHSATSIQLVVVYVTSI